MPPPDQKELDNLKGKLNVLSAIIRLGHEAFRKNDLETTASCIVNNTKLLANYGRACIIDMRGLSPSVLAVSGQAVPKQDSEYNAAMRRLASSVSVPAASPLILRATGNENISEAAQDEITKIFEGRSRSSMIMFQLSPPAGNEKKEEPFLWIVEFFDGETPQDASTLGLLAQHYAEAIWFRAAARPGFFSELHRLRKLNPVKVIAGVLLFTLILLFAVRVRQYAVSDFEISPANDSIVYSQLAGTLRKVIKANGDKASEGETVLEFDTDELNFKLADSLNEYDQVTAELNAARQKSFSNPELIAKAQLLDIKRKQDEINIAKIRWALSKSILKSPASGTVVMDEKEKMTGKSVKPGDKLFEIIPQDKLIAEIYLSERDASVIGKGMTVSLYLHTQPETPLRGEIISVSPKPTLTEDRRFCYIIKFRPDKSSGLICGMRGVARVGGEKVSLGYHLFRSVVLWWRKI